MADDEAPDALHRRVVGELERIRRLGLGTGKASQLRVAAPVLWAAAVAAKPARNRADDEPLRSLLRRGTAMCEPAIGGAALADVFGVSAETYRMKTVEARRWKAVRHYEDAGYDPPPPPNTFRQQPQYEPALVAQLAARLLEVIAADQVAATPARPQPEGFVARPELSAALDAAATSSSRMFVWGEPGVGKTTLVQDFLAGQGNPPSLWLRWSGRDVLERDLLRALWTEGQQTDGLNFNTALERFGRLLHGPMKAGVVVFDDVNDDELLAELRELAAGPGPMRLVVVARIWLPLEGFEAVRVREMTSSESAELCAGLGLSADQEQTAQLCEVLGQRPLAIRQAVKFSQAAGMAVDRLIRAVLTAPAGSVHQFADSMRDHRNLAAVYRAMLAELDTAPGGLRMLDAALWTSARGQVDVSNLATFSETTFLLAGLSLLDRDAAWARLQNFGLVDNVPDGSGGVLPLFHPLTWEVLTEMRGPQGEDFAAEMLAELETAARGPELARRGLTSELEASLAMLAVEFDVAVALGREPAYSEWGYAFLVNERMWVHVAPADGPTPGRRLLILEITPYAIFGVQSGRRNLLTRAFCDTLAEFGEAYQAEINVAYEAASSTWMKELAAPLHELIVQRTQKAATLAESTE